MSAEDRNGKVSTDEGCTTRERSFDQLTKGLASATVSRRGALRLLATTLLGGALASVPGVGRIAGDSGEAQAATCATEGQSCTAQKCCRGFTCLTDQTSGTEKFCCLTTEVCGQVCCPTGGICSTLGSGSCPCPTDKTRCTSTADPIGTCIDLRNDVNNCGACGKKCPGPAGNQPCGKAACVAGQCAIVPDATKTGTVCRQAAGPCDVAEVCSGASAECPPDVFLPVTTQCRAASGACEGIAFCTGNGAQCPANPLLLATTVCREAAGPCDVAEFCTGTSNQCPENAFAPATTPCREASGACEGIAFCTGNGAQCPANPLLPVTTVCRAAAGPCDVPEFCTGTSNQCPENAFVPAGTICRDAEAECDIAATCTGNSAACPDNGFKASTVICRPAVNECDVAEFCTGNSARCPENGFKPNGTPCNRDNDLCTLDTCQNGVCEAGSQKTCPASTQTCKVNVCDPATGDCITQNAPNNTPCTSSNKCITGGATCQNGNCQGGTTKTCPTGQTCDPTTGGCKCTTGVTCGNNCCTGNRPFCCPAGTPRAGQCRANSGACN